MKDYFVLQYTMTNRRLKEAGIRPILGYALGLIAFVLISEAVFRKTAFASYLVMLTCLSFLFNLSQKNRSDFLLATFGDKKKRRLRMVENLIVSIPFLAVLIFKNELLESILLLGMSLATATFSFHTDFDFTMPTPFAKTPFEFSVGFRKSFYIFPIAYTLAIIAVNVDNLNLGIFSMLLVYLTSLSYYTKPENEHYVWVYADTPRTFIYKKLKTAAKNASLLTAPILLGLTVFYPDEFGTILLFYMIGLLFLWTIILAKYSVYPQEMNIPEGLLIAFGIYFPPILLAVMPFFYGKSIHKLKTILND